MLPSASSALTVSGIVTLVPTGGFGVPINSCKELTTPFNVNLIVLAEPSFIVGVTVAVESTFPVALRAS